MATKPTTIDATAWFRCPVWVVQFDDGNLAMGTDSIVFATPVRTSADEFAAELRSHGTPCRVRRAKRIVVEL